MEEGRHENRKVNKNSEAKFASPETNEGIGCYVNGEQVSPQEFSERVARDAVRTKAEPDEEE